MFLLIRSSTGLTDKIVSGPKKLRDKTLRHSRSMPLQNIGNIEEAYERSRPVYRGQYPLKASDVQLVVDSRGCPDAPVQHPAFDPVVEQCAFSSPIKKSSRKDLLAQFPAPPIDKPLPRRPKEPAPPLRLYDNLYDNLLPPNPAFERQQFLCDARAQNDREPYRQPIVERSQSTTSSRHYPVVVPPQAWAETTLFRDGVHGEESGGQTIMTHSNFSTKSLGANVRLRDGPARRVVVTHSTRHDPRPRMHSSASSGSIMDNTPPTSSRRYGRAMESRQRQASNASTATRQGAEFGYISQADSHYHKTTSSASRSRPPKSPYRS